MQYIHVYDWNVTNMNNPNGYFDFLSHPHMFVSFSGAFQLPGKNDLFLSSESFFWFLFKSFFELSVSHCAFQVRWKGKHQTVAFWRLCFRVWVAAADMQQKIISRQRHCLKFLNTEISLSGSATDQIFRKTVLKLILCWDGWKRKMKQKWWVWKYRIETEYI